MYRSIHDVAAAARRPRAVHPTHGAGSLCSTGIGDARRRRSATSGARPAAGPDGHRRLRAGAARRPAGDPALFRADAARSTRPGRRCSARRVPCRGRWPARSRWPWPPARRSSTPGRRPGTPRRTSRARSRSRPGRRSGRGSAGWWTPDRPVVLIAGAPRGSRHLMRQAIRIGRERRRATWTAASRHGPIRAGRARTGACRSTSSPRRCRPAAPRRRSSSTSARRTSTRPATYRAPGTSTAARCPTVLDELPRDRPIAAICERLPREHRDLAAARGGLRRGSRRSAAGCPDWEAQGYPVDYGAGARRTRRGRSHAPAAPAHGPTAEPGAERQPAPRRPPTCTPSMPERGDREQHRVEHDHQPDRRPRPARCRSGRCGGRPSAACR